MLRLSLFICLALPLAACAATKPPQHEFGRLDMQSGTSVISSEMVSPEQSLAAMAVDNGVTPCPRFLHNLGVAEQATDAVPKDYPHML